MAFLTGNVIKITVHLHTILQRKTIQGPQRQLEVDIPAGTNMQELALLLELELDQENTLLVINGKHVDLDRIIRDGDEVHFIPAISGGLL